GAAAARHEREHRRLVADEDERLHDLVEVAADRLRSRLRSSGRSRELLEARVGSRGPEERGDALDRLRPGHQYQASSMKMASPKPTLCISSISSADGGSSTDNAISACLPSRVRETAMLAMLKPRAPNIVPTRPITPGMSS